MKAESRSPTSRLLASAHPPLYMAILALCMWAPCVTAGEAPSPWWLERMNHDFPASRSVRVSGDVGLVEVWNARAESVGVRGESFRSVRGGLVAPGLAENDPRLLAWVTIERVHVPSSAAGFGALLGAFLGNGAAIAVAVADSRVGAKSDLRPLAFMAGGACLGALIMAPRQRWHQYYPPLDPSLELRPMNVSRDGGR